MKSVCVTSICRNHDKTPLLTSDVPFAVVGFSVGLSSLISANVLDMAEKGRVTLPRACLGL